MNEYVVQIVSKEYEGEFHLSAKSAKQAFERALEVWSYDIEKQSDVTIHVKPWEK